MSKLLPIVAVCWLAPGCLWATPTSQVSTRVAGKVAMTTDGHAKGGSTYISGGLAGLYFGAELGAQSVELGPVDADTPTPPPQDYTGVDAGLLLRASLPGVLPTDHRLERYLDFGAELGGDLGVVLWDGHVGNEVRGYVGAWVEVGTFSVGDHYVSIVGDLRSMEYDDNWADDVVLGVGLAWTSRRTATAEDLTFRD